LISEQKFRIRSHVSDVANPAELSLLQRLCHILAGVFGGGAACVQPAQPPATLAAALRAQQAEVMRRFAVVARKFFAGSPRPRNQCAGSNCPPHPRPDEPHHAGAAPDRPAPTPDPAPMHAAPASGLFKHVLAAEAAVYAGYLRDLLHDADMLALLAASPRARLLLRPLLRMMSDDPLPDCARLPRASAARSPARPAHLPPAGGPAPAGEPAPAEGPADAGTNSGHRPAAPRARPRVLGSIKCLPRTLRARSRLSRAPPGRFGPKQPRNDSAYARPFRFDIVISAALRNQPVTNCTNPAGSSPCSAI
jgi:hypothetical protein